MAEDTTEQEAQLKLAKAQSEADKLSAEARTAQIGARTSEREEAEAVTPAGVQRRQALADKEVVEAGKAVEAARQSQISALVPDLSKVDRGSLELKGDAPLFGNPMAQRAADKAAEVLAARVAPLMGGASDWKVLVTADPDLVTKDSAYDDVSFSLRSLTDRAHDALGDDPATKMRAAFLIAPVIGAAAQAIPGVLSLLSAHRTATTATAETASLAATAAVAGALIARAGSPGGVVHDEFRLLPRGPVQRAVGELVEARQELVERKLELAADRASREAAKKQKADAARHSRRSGGAPAEREADGGTEDEQLAGMALKLSVIEALIAEIDAFLAAARSVPQGAKRSALATAALQAVFHEPAQPRILGDDDEASEQHPSAARRFTHVLVVQPQTGSTQQVVDDRPLWFEDKFSIVATACLTYMLLELPGGTLASAGNVHGKASASGKIGGAPPKIEPYD